MAPLLHHVIEASLPVLKICLLGAVGAGMARAGILDQQGRRTLSKLIYCLFTPSLTFTKLAPVLSGQHLLQWMPLLFNMFVSVAAGLLLGVLLLLVVRPPHVLRRHVLVATALGNAGNLPLVLVAALVRETGGKLFGGEALSENLAIAYVAMGIWAATMTHFTIGSELLKHGSTPAQQGRDNQHPADEQQVLPPSAARGDGSAPEGSPGKLCPGSSAIQDAAAAAQSSSEAGAASCVVELGQVAKAVPGPAQQEHAAAVTPHTFGGSSSSNNLSIHSNLSADCLVLASPVCDDTGSDKPQACVSCGTDRPAHQPLHAGRWQCPLCGRANHTAACKSAAAADSVHQQQQYDGSRDWQHSTQDSSGQEQVRLLDSAAGNSSSDGVQRQPQAGSSRSSSSSGSSSSRWRSAAGVAWGMASQLGSPPMVGCMLAVAVGLTRPVRDQLFAPEGNLLMLQDCIAMFGDCCIPCLLLMLGATLSKGPGSACPPLRVVVGVAAARLVLLPLLGTGWLVLAKTAGWYTAPDKMFILVMLIQNAAPTALNVHTLATLYGNREAEMGAMLFWQYLCCIVTLPAALTFFLWLLNTPLMSV